MSTRPNPTLEGTYKVNGNSTVAVVVEGGGNQVVAHVGLHALGSLADRLGLGDALSARIPVPGVRFPLHDRGKVMVQAMLMLAGGGEACSDIERLRSQPTLFGAVASDSTLYRTVRSLDAATLAGLWEAMAEARGEVWRRSSATTGKAPVILDLDASLIDIHSENKEGTAANYKSGFGFSPMFCFADATGEALAGLLRPGNATANSIADQLTVLDAAIDQLPESIANGHHRGDDVGSVRRAVEVRADSAGGSARLAAEFRARNVGFSVVARTNAQIQAAISRAADDQSRWEPAATQSGGERDGAAVAELSDLLDLSGWPPGTRLIVRREPRHPGAQTSLFPSLEFRFWGHYTDRTGTAVEADVHMRAHAHVEDNIRRLKASGLERFPFTDLEANKAWMALVCFAADLVRWFQLLCLTGPLAKAEPKTLRWQLWHTPARVVRRARQNVVRILEHWPACDELLSAYRRVALIT
ncbi:MAG: IS1380 family transposase [Acidimicrobiales bacterium]